MSVTPGRFFRAVFRTLVEIFLILIPSAFGIAGHSLMLFAIFLVFVCIVRNSTQKGTTLFRGATCLYLLLALFSLDGVSVLWAFLYNGGLWYFLIYLSSIPAATLLMHRWQLLGLRWWHGTLIASHLLLAGMSGVLEVYYPGSDCESIQDGQGIELLLPYRFRDIVTPRHIVVMPDEKTVFIANRTQSTPSQYGLFILRLDSKRAAMVDLAREVPAHIAYDLVENQLLVLTYRELEGLGAITTRYVPPTAGLHWIDTNGVHTRTVALQTPGDLYSFVIPEREIIHIVFHMQHLRYVRETESLHRSYLPDDGMAHAIMDIKIIDNEWIFAYGGSWIQFMLTPAIIKTAALDQADRRTRYKSFGYSIIEDDIVHRRIFAVSSLGSVIDVLDYDLDKRDEVVIGGNVRRIAIDSPRRVGYVGQYLTGNLIIFDLDSFDILGQVKIGKNIRAIVPLQDGRVLAGSKCGIFLLDSEVLFR